jgi:hypothetical protein
MNEEVVIMEVSNSNDPDSEAEEISRSGSESGRAEAETVAVAVADDGADGDLSLDDADDDDWEPADDEDEYEEDDAAFERQMADNYFVALSQLFDDTTTSPELRLQTWEDIVSYMHDGCPAAKGIGCLLPSMIDIHDKPIVLEDFIELETRIQQQQKRPIPEEGDVPTYHTCDDEACAISLRGHVDELTNTWVHQCRSEPSVQDELSHFPLCTEQDDIGYLLSNRARCHTVPLIIDPASPQDEITIHKESFIQLAMRAGCICLRRDAYSELHRLFTERVFTTAKSCANLMHEAMDITNSSCQTATTASTPSFITCEIVQRAMRQHGYGIIGYGFYGYADLTNRLI